MGATKGGGVDGNASVDFDSILKKIGQCGKWQLFNFFLLWLTSAAGGLAVVVYSFTAKTTSYRCNIPYCENEDYFLGRGSDFNLSIVKSNDADFFCKYYDIPSQSFTSCEEYIDALNRSKPEDLKEEFCTDGDVVWDRSIFSNTLAMDYKFTCGRSFYHQLVGASYMLGMLVGSFVLGFVSDYFGRMKALMLSVILVSVSGFIGAFMTEPWGFAIIRLITGMGGIGCFMVTFVLAVEYVGFKYTMLIGIAIEIPFALGELVLGLEAYFIRDWQALQMVAYTPLILLLLLWFIVPESPRWLIAKGRLSESREIIAKAAKMNGRQIDVDSLFKNPTQNSMASEDNNDKKATFLDLFRPLSIMLRSLNMFFQWFSVTMCYYGLTFAAADYSDNPFTNFSLSVFIEIPAYIFCIIFMDAWGRRPILSFCQLISGLSCVGAGFLTSDDQKIAQMFLALIGKFGASACFAIVYVYTAELFPTIIRNTAIGSSSTVARVGGICAIIIGLIKDYWLGGPMIIMGIVAIIAGCLAFFFPETVGHQLPDTMEDAINIGKNNTRGFCTCVFPNIGDYFKDDDDDDKERTSD